MSKLQEYKTQVKKNDNRLSSTESHVIGSAGDRSTSLPSLVERIKMKTTVHSEVVT